MTNKKIEELRDELTKAKTRYEAAYLADASEAVCFAYFDLKRIKDEIAKLEKDNELERLEDELVEAEDRAKAWANANANARANANANARAEVETIKAKIKALKEQKHV